MATVNSAFQTAIHHHRAGQQAQAEQIYRQILAAAPGHAGALHMLGVLALQRGRPAEAVESIERAIAADNRQAAFHVNLGEAHRALGQIEQAVDCYRRALDLDPQLPEAYNNLGLTQQTLGRFDAAADQFRRAIALRADNVEAHYNLSRVLLLQGDFRNGWQEYAWRTRMRGHPSQSLSAPEWNGAAAKDKRVLVYAEQGLGDTLQFVRYLAHVRTRVGELVTVVPPPLVPLLTNSGFENLLPQGAPLPQFDMQCSLLSLPGLCGTDAETILQAVPYLRPDEALVERWRAKLAALPGYKIGIAWQGNPAFYSDRFRSFALSEFQPLAAVPGVQLVSLQVGAATGQIAALAGRFRVATLEGLDATSGPFMDTAAVMSQLDLIVTSDTAVAHLAGGLGVPVWVALPLAPDWRWLLGRDDSPWYPTMRLFRQTRFQDWSDVFGRMAAALREKTNA